MNKLLVAIFKVTAALCIILMQSSPVYAESLRDRQIDVYVQALSMKKDYEKIREILQKETDKASPSEIQRLMKLAQYGMDNNAPEAAASAYEKVLTQQDNITARRNLGTLLFAKRQYSSALKLLDDYNKKTGGDYVTNFEQGEILHSLRKGNEKAEALPFYRRALEEASFMGGGKDAETVRAKSFFRLGETDKASEIFAALGKKYPDDIFLITDYAGMLYEARRYEEAFKELAKLPDDLYEPGCLTKYKLDDRQTEDIIVRIVLMRIAYQLEKKNYFAVKAMQEDLESHFPSQPDTALAKAAFYGSFSNWRAQLANLQQGMEFYKEDEELKTEEANILREHGSFVENNSGLKLSDGGSREFILETRGEVRLIDGLRIGSVYTIDFARLYDVPRQDGDVADYTGIRKQAEVYLQEDFMNGDTARVSYFDQEGIPGVGGSYKMLDYWGDTSLTGAFRDPYWDTPQAVAEKGARSFLELGRTLKPTEALTISGKGSLNSYGLEHDDDLARSMGLGAHTEYKLPSLDLQKKLLGDESVFSLNHEYTYETFDYYKETSEGQRMYDPADLHLHAFYLAFSNQFTSKLKGSLSGGCSYDVLANKGSPIYGISLSYLVTPELEVSASANHVISTTRYFYTGIGIKYSFTPYTMADFIRTLPTPPSQQQTARQ